MKNVSITQFPKLGFAAEEAVNTLCTNLTFSGENVRKIMITSCHASEGKSFTSINIMRTLASFGRTVVLVDADLRRSMLRGTYGIQYNEDKPRGLAHMLAGMASFDEIIYETDIENAFFVPEGRDAAAEQP